MTTQELAALAFIVAGVALLLAAAALWLALQARTYADRAAGSAVAARTHENRARALARQVKLVTDGWLSAKQARQERGDHSLDHRADFIDGSVSDKGLA